MELLRCVPRYFFRYTLFTHKLRDTFSPTFSPCFHTRLFRKVEQHVAISPTDILMDFRRAALNSVRQVYPNTEFKGWFYHFSSNIWKHIQNLGLQNYYQDDENLVASYAFCTSFRTTKWCYTLFWITDRRNLQWLQRWVQRLNRLLWRHLHRYLFD